MTPGRHAGAPSSGFTLLELLVALAVFAVVAVTVYTRTGDVIRQTGSLEERTVATWLADNELALIRMSRLSTSEVLPTGSDSRQVIMAGRTWEVTSRVGDTTHPWLRRVEVDVAPLATDGATNETASYRVVGFVGRY